MKKKKEDLVRKLGALAKRLFRTDNLMISYTAAAEGLAGIEEQVKGLKEKLFYRTGGIPGLHPALREKKNEGFKNRFQSAVRGKGR